jgi:16S rRNA (cytidine1402-2'-O)-methyltransferase
MPLLVCATPIGNLEDVTIRVLEALREADAVLCEDTRRTKVLLDRHEIRARSLVTVHRHNEARQAHDLVPRLSAGETLALVSDAGLPGVNDPGGRLVSAALEAGVEVTVLPGPSAVETALVASALAAAQYRFLGYLPRRAAELDALWHESRDWPYAAVAFESPKRLPTSLAALARIDPERRVAVCRELTKRFEEVVRGRPRRSKVGSARRRRGDHSRSRTARREAALPRRCGRRRARPRGRRDPPVERRRTPSPALGAPPERAVPPLAHGARLTPSAGPATFHCRVARAENEGGASCIVFSCSARRASRPSSFPARGRVVCGPRTVTSSGPSRSGATPMPRGSTAGSTSRGPTGRRSARRRPAP